MKYYGFVAYLIPCPSSVVGWICNEQQWHKSVVAVVGDPLLNSWLWEVSDGGEVPLVSRGCGKNSMKCYNRVAYLILITPVSTLG